MAFKLPGFGGKKTNIKGDMDRKYGHGDYARGGKKFEERMKPGESKFNYDVRMRKAKGSTESTSSTRSSSTYKEPDPKSEINVKQDKTLPYDYQPQERNPGDLRVQHYISTSRLPSAPGDDWTYEFRYDPQYDYESEEEYLKGEGKDFVSERVKKILSERPGGFGVWATDKDGNRHVVKPGSKSDKAIRERYTGSETGDLRSWYGHDTSEYASSFSDTEEGDDELFNQSYTSTSHEKESYLPYDLAQKRYNPKYKGSKK